MQVYPGYLFILLAAACWALLGPVARFSLNAGMAPLDVAFWRALFGGLFFLLHALVARDSLRPHSRADALTFLLFGAFSIGGFFGSYLYAVRTGGAALASVLLYTAPAWVAVLSRIFLGERISAVKVGAIALSLAGVFCISFSSMAPAPGRAGIPGLLPGAGGNALFGILFGLLAGFLYSTHYIVTTRQMKRYPPHILYAYALLAGALALLPFVEWNFSRITLTDWAVFFFLGFVSTYCAYQAYCAGLARLVPTRAAVLATLEPVLATAAAWWLWDERLALAGWFGAALILAAVLILVMNRTPSKASPPKPAGPNKDGKTPCPS